MYREIGTASVLAKIKGCRKKLNALKSRQYVWQCLWNQFIPETTKVNSVWFVNRYFDQVTHKNNEWIAQQARVSGANSDKR